MRNAQLALKLKRDGVEQHQRSWVDEMRDHARRVSGLRGSVCADDIRVYADELQWWPQTPNAYGAVFRGNNWRPAGWMASRHPGNHGRHIRVWKWIA